MWFSLALWFHGSHLISCLFWGLLSKTSSNIFEPRLSSCHTAAGGLDESFSAHIFWEERVVGWDWLLPGWMCALSGLWIYYYCWKPLSLCWAESFSWRIVLTLDRDVLSLATLETAFCLGESIWLSFSRVVHYWESNNSLIFIDNQKGMTSYWILFLFSSCLSASS